MSKKVKKIHFRSVDDFRKRIPRLWQNQGKGEVADFSFEDQATRLAFNKLYNAFKMPLEQKNEEKK